MPSSGRLYAMLPTPVSTIRNEGFASKFDFNQSVPAITKVYHSLAIVICLVESYITVHFNGTGPN